MVEPDNDSFENRDGTSLNGLDNLSNVNPPESTVVKKDKKKKRKREDGEQKQLKVKNWGGDGPVEKEDDIDSII